VKTLQQHYDLADVSLVGVCGTLLLLVAAAAADDDNDALFIFTVKLVLADA